MISADRRIRCIAPRRRWRIEPAYFPQDHVKFPSPLHAGYAAASTINHPRTNGCNVLSIMLMLLLLVGCFGLFVGLVFFSEGVIEPNSTS